MGVAAVLAGEFNLRGQAKRVRVAVVSVAALEGISLALHDLATRNPIAVPAMYIAVFLAAGASLYVLLRRPSRREVPAQPSGASACSAPTARRPVSRRFEIGIAACRERVGQRVLSRRVHV